MKYQSVFIIAAIFTSALLTGCDVDSGKEKAGQKNPDANPLAAEPEARAFQVTSPSFDDGATFPAQYTCEGKPFASGHTPELQWSKGPDGTESYAIIFADVTLIEAGKPNYAYHWAMWNIPGNQQQLPEGIPGLIPEDPDKIVDLPASLEGAKHAQARGFKQFFGPCPSWLHYCTNGSEPLSEDRYHFTVYAMPDREINVPEYDPEVNPNYVDMLNTLFKSIALDHAVISATSAAAPTSLPFPCPE